MPLRKQGGCRRSGFERAGRGSRLGRIIRRKYIVSQSHDSFAGIARAMRRVVGAQLRLARLCGNGVGRDFQFHRVHHGGAHVGVDGCDIQLLASLHEQFFADHIVEDFAPLARPSRAAPNPRSTKSAAAAEKSLREIGCRLTKGHVIFRRHNQSGGAPRGEQRISRHQQSKQRTGAHEREGTPAARLPVHCGCDSEYTNSATSRIPAGLMRLTHAGQTPCLP